MPVRPSGAAMYSSIAVPPSRSSTTRSGTCTSDLAPIGKYRIGTPSRISTRAINSSAVLPPRKYSAWATEPSGTT